jgi:hypothetical protein
MDPFYYYIITVTMRVATTATDPARALELAQDAFRVWPLASSIANRGTENETMLARLDHAVVTSIHRATPAPANWGPV